nr:hypothetical protein [Tanacetum cinerariifolium]
MLARGLKLRSWGLVGSDESGGKMGKMVYMGLAGKMNSIFNVVVNRVHVDYAALLWWDFLNYALQKKDVIQYPRFTKLIIVDLLKKFDYISLRHEEDYHSIKDDILLMSVYFTRNVTVRGMLIPDEFITDDICATKEYKEYMKVFVREKLEEEAIAKMVEGDEIKSHMQSTASPHCWWYKGFLGDVLVDHRNETPAVDHALVAAVQQTVRALLRELTTEIATSMNNANNANNPNNVNMRNGRSGGNGNRGNGGYAPATIHVWLERFRKQKPLTFSSAPTSVEAENWIAHIEKIF